MLHERGVRLCGDDAPHGKAVGPCLGFIFIKQFQKEDSRKPVFSRSHPYPIGPWHPSDEQSSLEKKKGYVLRATTGRRGA